MRPKSTAKKRPTDLTRNRKRGNRRHCSWAKLPYTTLVEIYKNLSDEEKVITAQVCRDWNKAFKHPTLWRSRTFEFGGPRAKISGESAVQFVEQFGSYLRHVRVVCRHITSSTCETITCTLEPFAKSLECANLQLFEMVGLELDSFWKYPFLRGRVAESLKNLICRQQNLEVLEMSSAQFGLHPGLEILETLVVASGTKLWSLVLEEYFHSRLALFQNNRFLEVMKKFTNLNHIALNYCCLSEELLNHWGTSLKGRLKSIRIKACDNEPHGHVINADTWSRLRSVCPALSVDLSVLSISPASSVIPILTPSMPVVALHIWSGFDNDAEMQLSSVLNHITTHYHQKLQHLSIDFDNFHDDIDEALVRIIARCRNLTSLRVKANASVQVVNAICHMVRERQNSLTDVNITLCDISEPDIEQLRDLQEEMQPFVDQRGINLVLHDNFS